MKLYLSPAACSLAAHITLEEAALAYDTEVVDLRTRQLASGGDFTQVNPKGYIPALLLDDGELLTELPAIVQYIADLVPERQLAPPNGTRERYRLQGWLTFVGTELHKSFIPFFFPGAGEEWKKFGRGTLKRRLAWTNGELADRQYLIGDGFTVADAYLFTVLRWTGMSGLDLATWPGLTAFQQRVAARPAVQAALRAEGLA